MYNIEHNIISDELSNDTYGSYYKTAYSGENHCRYYYGGTWINIEDDETEYLNLYVEPKEEPVKEIKGVEENPKTGLNYIYTVVALILALVFSFVYIRVFKNNTYFQK